MASGNSTETVSIDDVASTTTKGHADNAYELLHSCIDKANSIGGHIYADEHVDISQPMQAGLHGCLVEVERLCRVLDDKLATIWSRL